MSLALTRSIALQGLHGEIVEIEVDVSHGLPAYTLLGLPDAALFESRDRIRAAITNSRRIWPNKKVTVALSPAWLPKSGSGFDLPIALAILAASEQLSLDQCKSTLFIAELALDGSLRGIRGLLPMAIAARRHGITSLVVADQNFHEANLLGDMEVLSFPHLTEVLRWISTGERSAAPTFEMEITANEKRSLDFADVGGQMEAKDALEIAAIGGHHALMIGPPGTGKTMLAERFPSILPPLDREQAIEVTAIHSVAGILRERSALSDLPPFIAPHHSTTVAAMVGGGSGQIRPGACSLAHNGILFIDEAPECASGILDSLRQPLESGSVSISRASGTITYPARFQLILAANPCPCGRFFGRGRSCECSSLQVRRYLNKLSGPLMDRMDIRILVESPRRGDLAGEGCVERSSDIRIRVMCARQRARERFAGERFSLNSQIPSDLLRTKYRAGKDAMNRLHVLVDDETLTARGFHKVLRLAWSIADSRKIDLPGSAEVESALELRNGLRT